MVTNSDALLFARSEVCSWRMLSRWRGSSRNSWTQPQVVLPFILMWCWYFPMPSNMVIVMLMDSISEGAVLVSFGSALKPEQMPAEKIQVFVDTFKNLGMKVFRWIINAKNVKLFILPILFLKSSTLGGLEVECGNAWITWQYLFEVGWVFSSLFA